MANRITEILGIEKPIIQGPLAWLTNGRYAGAVSAAGGLGVLGISAGQTEAAKTVEETIENMRREIRIARQITDKPLGINVAPGHPMTDVFTGPMLDLMVEEGVQVAVMVGNFSAEWTARFHEKGIKEVFRAGNPTVENTDIKAFNTNLSSNRLESEDQALILMGEIIPWLKKSWLFF